MSFWPRTRREEPAVTQPVSDPNPIIRTGDRSPVQNLADTSSRHVKLEPEDDRPDCPHCRGTGKVQTTADYLAEIVAMLPSADPAKMDTIIADFYTRLVGTDTVKGAAPHLRKFFPADLVTGDALNSKGNKQRDQLLNALVAILTRYDPDHPKSEGMTTLAENAKTWGRSHAEWDNHDGTYYVPTEEDYLAVRNVLAQLLMDGIGKRFEQVHINALVRAYRYVSLKMQESADEWRMERGTPAVARQTRQAETR